MRNSMNVWWHTTGAFLGSMFCSLALAGHVWAAGYDSSPEAEAFIGELVRDNGFAEEQLLALFAEAQRKEPILAAISKPAERVKPWKVYRPIFITDARVAQGVDFWRQHEEALSRAEKQYGVPAQVIVAIIGVETFYGRNTGSWRVLDALSTLAFDYPPRASFFRQQLKEFLMLVREQQVDPLSLKGSYAGAMGLPQFMPGSFRAYAVDFDGDGHINIWSDPTDAIGSVANYFYMHGWQSGQPVVSRAQVNGQHFQDGLTEGLEAVKNVGQLRSLGWQPEQPMDSNLQAIAFRLDGDAGDEYWLGLPNFYVITRYNRSIMYAMAVHQLSERLSVAKHGAN